MRRLTLLPVSSTLAGMLLLAACAGPSKDDTAPDPVSCTAEGPLDATLTLPDVQALGTHNSYHVEPDEVLDASHAYTQPPLDEQADLGVRAFELDVHRREDGEFLVFHLPSIDPESTCETLADCLGVLRSWSDAHPCHVPFVVWLEPKDDLDEMVEGLTSLEGHMTELDAAVEAAWPDRVLRPDDVRGDHTTLPEGIAAGWPLLADTRGSLMLALLDSGERRAEYLDGAPALEGRTIFVDSDSEGDAFAATFKIDDAAGEAETVGRLVEAGFLVTSNVDAADEDDTTNQASFDASLAAGPNHLASDQVVPGEGYVAELPGGSPRCHPARVAECGPETLEP